MPIKSLESLLFESKLVNSSSISILQNATIGIDVEHYLSRIYTFKKEQYLFGIGGAPSSLSGYIKSDMKVFNEFNIRPIFVLPGLPINEGDQSIWKNQLTPQEQHLEATWARLSSKHSIISGNTFGYLGESFRLNLEPLPTAPMVNDIISLLIENEIDYIISPYDASFQLSYMYQKGIIDSIYGSTDTLLTKVDKFILGMEFQSKDFRFVDKQKVLSEFNLTERQFLDLSIMVGCSAQPETFSNLPPLPTPNHMSPIQHLGYFKIALDIYFQYVNFRGSPPDDLYGYVSSLNDPQLLELYKQGHAAIKYMPVMNCDGIVELYLTELVNLGLAEEGDIIYSQSSSEKDSSVVRKPRIPAGLHSVISQRLPSEFYFYQSLGLIPIKLLEAITSGTYIVRPPLEVGNGSVYRKLVSSDKAQKILDAQFNILTSLLARYYQVKRIKVFYWFKDDPVELNQRHIPSVSEKINQLSVPSSQLNNFGQLKFWDYLKSSSALTQSNSAETHNFVATSFLRALSLVGLVDKNASPSREGQVFLAFLSKNFDVSENNMESLLLILVLCMQESFSVFTNNASHPSVPKSFKDGSTGQELTQDESKAVALISKIFTLVKFDIHPINYQGPISRSLLAFRSQVKVIQEMFQHSTQVCLVDMIVRDEKVKLDTESRKCWYEFVGQLPFYSDLNNTLLGVMSEIYFEYGLRAKKSGKTLADCVNSGRSHLLDSILQVNKPSYNINLNSVNSVTSSQFDVDFKAGLQLWKQFKSLSETMFDAKLNILTDGDMNILSKADDIIRDFIGDQM